ncbi:MAG: hypothetical protein ACKVHV_02905 [Flavobacteriales bacterium]|jgi:hypothetical protein|uniref:hypothetical protein n=1 Tax=uncultured Polaribacter sp. TaxID=174711 RepID=UPI0023715C26|nr:hypothetical protein [Polaribacter sp.]
MKLFKIIYWLIYPILIVVFMLIFDQLFETNNFIVKAGSSAVLAFMLSPRKKIIQTEKGKIKQITWLFLKEPIGLD